jgi:hypothetical protein
MLATKGMRFPIVIILVCIRWYAAYPLSYRHLEEMMEERGVAAAGGWMKPISRSRAPGNTFTVRWTRTAKQSTSC